MSLDATIGGASADSYVTLAEFTAYALAQGWTATGTDAAKEAMLRRAALSVDVSYGFVGITVTVDQALQWPRVWTGLVNGWPVASDSIPQAIKSAQMEMAYLISGGADPMATLDGVIASERVKAGPVESDVTYQGGKGLPRYTAVSRLLRPYLTAGQGQVSLVRA